MHGAKKQTTTPWTGTRKARKESRTLAESYLRQKLHKGVVSEETAPTRPRAPPDIGAPFWTIKICSESSRLIVVKITVKHGEAP